MKSFHARQMGVAFADTQPTMAARMNWIRTTAGAALMLLSPPPDETPRRLTKGISRLLGT
jgi:hypothetical protein